MKFPTQAPRCVCQHRSVPRAAAPSLLLDVERHKTDTHHYVLRPSAPAEGKGFLIKLPKAKRKTDAFISRYFSPPIFTSSFRSLHRLYLPLQHHLSSYSSSYTLRKSPSQHHHPLLRLLSFEYGPEERRCKKGHGSPRSPRSMLEPQSSVFSTRRWGLGFFVRLA